MRTPGVDARTAEASKRPDGRGYKARAGHGVSVVIMHHPGVTALITHGQAGQALGVRLIDVSHQQSTIRDEVDAALLKTTADERFACDAPEVFQRFRKTSYA